MDIDKQKQKLENALNKSSLTLAQVLFSMAWAVAGIALILGGISCFVIPLFLYTSKPPVYLLWFPIWWLSGLVLMEFGKGFVRQADLIFKGN